MPREPRPQPSPAAPILIAGAGPTGMTMAIELRRLGLPVRIIDKATHLAQHSQALVLQARTLEQLERYDIASEAIARGRKLTHATFVSEGKRILSIGLERIRSRYPYVLFLPQSETEQILNAHMESLGVRTERGIELTSVENHAAGVAATLRHPDGREESLETPWLIGCDGAHSRVREALGIPFEGASVGLSFFLGDLEIEGPDAPGDELTIHVQSGDVVFLGRLDARLTRVIVALHSQQNLGAEDAEAFASQTLSLADFQRAIDHAGLRITAKSATWMTPFRVNDRQARHYHEGNAFLAGDASHIHSPVGGQGMNTGMQDAANLAWKLAAVARGADPRLLDSYEEERGAVGRALLRTTSRGLALATSTNPLLERLRDALLPILTKFPGVQDTILGFVSETAIAYHHSSAVVDAGGDGSLRAGDRMPDLTLHGVPEYPTLLTGWNTPRHLALVLEAPVSAGSLLASRHAAWPHLDSPHIETRVLSIASFGDAAVDDPARKLLGHDTKLILVRPDGYIGYRGIPRHNARLAAYLQQNAIAQQDALA